MIALYFAAPLFERYEQRLRKELALPVIMKADDVDVHTARQTMTISKCDYETADLLSLSIGDPVALVRREIRDSAGRIICLADVIYRVILSALIWTFSHERRPGHHRPY